MTERELKIRLEELRDIGIANNKILKAILIILKREDSSDFTNNIIANIIGNGIMPMR